MSVHVDDCLIACKSATVIADFKQDLLSRFVGTDEEVTEYFGCEIIRDREAKTQRLFNLAMLSVWDCLLACRITTP